MTKRRMINTMSTKKRDTMIVTSPGGLNPNPATLATAGRTISMGHSTIDGTNVHVILFNPTHRFLVPNNAAYQAFRTSSRPYIKGLLERIDLGPSDGSTWRWRRVVIAMKTRVGLTDTIEANIGAQATAGATSYRQVRDLSGQSTGEYQQTNALLQGVMFAGQQGIDYLTPMNAKLDRSRVTVIKDVSRTISSGNELGRPRIVRDWTPVNKTLVYDDDENGLNMVPSPLSVNSRAGIGNIYVVDFFNCPGPGDSSANGSAMTFNPASTLYWHEK